MAGTLNIPKPERHISCQDLLRHDNISVHGTLRVRGAVNKLVENVVSRPTSLGIRWPRMYVILHKGCLYIFKDENSKSISKATSLFGFSEACTCNEEMAGSDVAWPFVIIRELDLEEKTFHFSAPSQTDMQNWITKINEQILFANGGRLVTNMPQRLLKPPPQHSAGAMRPRLPTPEELSWDDEEDSCSNDSHYDEILNATDDTKGDNAKRGTWYPQAPAVKTGKRPPVGPKPPQPGKPTSNPVVSELTHKFNTRFKSPHCDDNFDEITAVYAPGGEYQDVDQRSEDTVVLCERPKPGKKDDLIERALWKNSPDAGEQLMKTLTEEGAFMLRNSRDASCQILLVRTPGVVRKFKISLNDAGSCALTAEQGPWFPTMSELIAYYIKNKLPKLSVRLTNPYADCVGS